MRILLIAIFSLFALNAFAQYEDPTSATGGGGGSSTWTGLSDTPGTITALQCVRGNAGGTALEFVACAGSQTPWTSNIDADGFNLTDVGQIEFGDTLNDLILTREGAAILQLGEDSATPVNQEIKAPDGSGTDIDGASMTISGGDGSATNSDGGNLILNGGVGQGTGVDGVIEFGNTISRTGDELLANDVLLNFTDATNDDGLLAYCQTANCNALFLGMTIDESTIDAGFLFQSNDIFFYFNNASYATVEQTTGSFMVRDNMALGFSTSSTNVSTFDMGLWFDATDTFNLGTAQGTIDGNLRVDFLGGDGTTLELGSSTENVSDAQVEGAGITIRQTAGFCHSNSDANPDTPEACIDYDGTDTYVLSTDGGTTPDRNLSAQFLQGRTTAGITASTTQTQGQGALTAQNNEVSTVANANDTVTMPTAVAGRRVVIINNGANTLQIFPASGDNLGAGVDTAVTLATATNVEYITYDATNWEQL